MFATAYQGGPAVEVLACRGSNPQGQFHFGMKGDVEKIFESAVKGWVYSCAGGISTKLVLPENSNETCMYLCFIYLILY